MCIRSCMAAFNFALCVVATIIILCTIGVSGSTELQSSPSSLVSPSVLLAHGKEVQKKARSSSWKSSSSKSQFTNVRW